MSDYASSSSESKKKKPRSARKPKKQNARSSTVTDDSMKKDENDPSIVTKQTENVQAPSMPQLPQSASMKPLEMPEETEVPIPKVIEEVNEKVSGLPETILQPSDQTQVPDPVDTTEGMMVDQVENPQQMTASNP